MKMRIKFCEKCQKRKYYNNPYSFVWWWIDGQGLMCYACAEKHYFRVQKSTRTGTT